jgi:hypothetical protein
MSAQNLKLTMEALGGKLNDPAQMREVLRTIVDRVVSKGEVSSAGYNLRPYDPTMPEEWESKRYNVLTNQMSEASPYYVNPVIQQEFLHGKNIERPGVTPQEFLESPHGDRLIHTWYGTTDGLRQTVEQVRTKMDDSGLEGLDLNWLNEAAQNPAMVKHLQERLGITTSVPKPLVINQNPGPITIIDEYSIKLLMDAVDAQGADGLAPPTLVPVE